MYGLFLLLYPIISLSSNYKTYSLKYIMEVTIMSFKDAIKNSFIENFSNGRLNSSSTLLVLAVTLLIGFYIFCIYKVICRETFYSKDFNISLVAVAIITAAIILTIQSSIVISLGMVGALSIVRFRTAIKNPMDLVFLFWSISVGIICGAGLFVIALITTAVLTICICGLNYIPLHENNKLLIINACFPYAEERLINVLNSYVKRYKIKSRNISNAKVDLILEIKLFPKKELYLLNELNELDFITSLSLISQEGESTF